jgi:hypothetical protein
MLPVELVEGTLWESSTGLVVYSTQNMARSVSQAFQEFKTRLEITDLHVGATQLGW